MELAKYLKPIKIEAFEIFSHEGNPLILNNFIILFNFIKEIYALFSEK
jgi:hypothetical protein